MNVIAFNRPAGGARRSGVALLVAATLVAPGLAAAQVERDDVAVPPAPPVAEIPAAPAAPAAPAVMDRERTPEVVDPGRAQADRERAQADRERAEANKERARVNRERAQADREHAQADRERARAERDAKLEEAKRRLEQAAAEVAALSSDIAAQAMQGVGSAFSSGPRRSIIGVQIEATSSGNGAKVRDVSPGGAAEVAGIKVGDEIVAINGKPVAGGAREVVRMLREIEPESTVNVRVLREGKPKEFKVTARRFDARTYAYSTAPDFDFDFDFDPSQWQFGPFGSGSAVSGGLGGMELTALTPQLARYFGTDKGLLVVRAPKNDVYQLQDGDVILSIDGRVPANGSQVTRILRSYSPGETLTLHIMRDRKALDLRVTLPEPTPRARGTRAARMVFEDGNTDI